MAAVLRALSFFLPVHIRKVQSILVSVTTHHGVVFCLHADPCTKRMAFVLFCWIIPGWLLPTLLLVLLLPLLLPN
jgi:hypothetical protein